MVRGRSSLAEVSLGEAEGVVRSSGEERVCPQPSKVPFRVDGPQAVSLLGAVAKFAVVHPMGREHTWSGCYSLAQRVFCFCP